MKKRKSPSLAPSSGGKEGGRNSPALKDGRVRPTNNQLLYKTHLRWDKHYTYGINPALNLPSETPGFPSVTSAFLRVLSALQKAEEDRCGRSILQLLSTNTRRTKVVELSSGTHRVPDELKKHYLSDATGGQYSTNLDRNRYGQDDNYLFTVIRYDLEFLGLCPCLVDVEIVDVKAGNQSIIVSAGDHYCKCKQNVLGAPGHCEGQRSTANGQHAAAATQSRRGSRHHGPAPPQLTTVPGTGNSSSQPQIMRMDSSGKLSDLGAAAHLPQRSSQLPPGHGQPPHPQQLPTGTHFPWDPSGFAAAVGAAPTLPFPGFNGPLTLPPHALNPSSTVGAGGARNALHPAGSLAGLHNNLSASTSLPSLPSLTLPPHASSRLHPLSINATTAAGAAPTQNPLHPPSQHGLPEHTLGLSVPPQLHPGGLIHPAHPNNLIGAGFPPNSTAGVGGAGTNGSSNPMLSPEAAGGMNVFSPLIAQGGILGGQGPPPSPGGAADVAAAAAPATTHSLQRSPMHRAEQNLPPSPPAINQQASSPQPSASGASQLFDTLVMAATGGQQGAGESFQLQGPLPACPITDDPHPAPSTAKAAGNSQQNTTHQASSKKPDDNGGARGGVGGGGGGVSMQWGSGVGGGGLHSGGLGGAVLDLIKGSQSQCSQEESEGGITGGDGGGFHLGGLGGLGGGGAHHRNSRLWSAMSFGDTSSLQNALDAFCREEEAAPQQPFSLGPEALAELAQASSLQRGPSQQHSQEEHGGVAAHEGGHTGGGGGGGGGGTGTAAGASGGALRQQRHRKPLRCNSFMMRCADPGAVDAALRERLGIKGEPLGVGGGALATLGGNNSGVEQHFSVDWASSARGSPAPGAGGPMATMTTQPQEGAGGVGGGLGVGVAQGAMGSSRRAGGGGGGHGHGGGGAVTACANGSAIAGGAAESVAEGDDHMEGGGGTTGGRGGEEQEVGSGSREAREAAMGGPGSEVCNMDMAARVHALEKELHVVRRESQQHVAARKAAEEQLISLGQELWQARRVQAILLSRLSGGAWGALEGSSLMPSGIDQASIDGALKGMLASLGWGVEVGEMEDALRHRQQQQQRAGSVPPTPSPHHQPQQQQQQQQQQPEPHRHRAFKAWHPPRGSGSGVQHTPPLGDAGCAGGGGGGGATSGSGALGGGSASAGQCAGGNGGGDGGEAAGQLSPAPAPSAGTTSHPPSSAHVITPTSAFTQAAQGVGGDGAGAGNSGAAGANGGGVTSFLAQGEAKQEGDCGGFVAAGSTVVPPFEQPQPQQQQQQQQQDCGDLAGSSEGGVGTTGAEERGGGVVSPPKSVAILEVDPSSVAAANAAAAGAGAADAVLLLPERSPSPPAKRVCMERLEPQISTQGLGLS